MKRKEELEAAGVHEVIFFHSSKDEMQKYQKDVPFDLVADPTKKHYREFGVETSVFAGLHPKAIWAGLRGAARGFITTKSEGGVHGLPADFLIDREGQIVAVKYGSHAYDQWSVSEVLELVKSQSVNSDQ